jgi:hypothetical protein
VNVLVYADSSIGIAKVKCTNELEIVKGIIREMGLTINESKTEMGQELVLLGVALSTVANNGKDCSAALTEKRRMLIASKCLALLHHKGPIRVSVLKSFLGLLVFASQVIFASRLYLRSGYALVNAIPDSGRNKYGMVTMSDAFRKDCAWWRKMMLKPEYCRTILNKWTASDSVIAWDASMWGMGGFCGDEQFSIAWADCRPTKVAGSDLAPMEGTDTWHINYMELFACFTAVSSFGSKLRGTAIVSVTDSTSVEAWIGKLWGPSHTIPLLKRLHLMLIRFDIRLIPVLVGSKANARADKLSRRGVRA